jgi:hypothetical protein
MTLQAQARLHLTSGNYPAALSVALPAATHARRYELDEVLAELVLVIGMAPCCACHNGSDKAHYARRVAIAQSDPEFFRSTARAKIWEPSLVHFVPKQIWNFSQIFARAVLQYNLYDERIT